MNGSGAGGSTAIVSGVDVDALAAAVRSCPAVVDLAAGELGSAATYLPGRRIVGLGVDDARVTIQIRSRWGASAGDVAEQIRAAVSGLVGARPIDIVIADIEVPPGEPDPTNGEPASGHRLFVGSPTAPPSELPPASAPPVIAVPPVREDAGR